MKKKKQPRQKVTGDYLWMEKKRSLCVCVWVEKRSEMRFLFPLLLLCVLRPQTPD